MAQSDTLISSFGLNDTTMPERRRKEQQRKPFNVDMAEQRIRRLFEPAERVPFIPQEA